MARGLLAVKRGKAFLVAVLALAAAAVLAISADAQTTTAVSTTALKTTTRHTTSRTRTRTRTRTASTTRRTTTKRSTTSRMLVKSTGHPINLPCKSGTYKFTKDNVAIYEDQFNTKKTEFIADWNGLGRNVVLNADGSIQLRLLRPSTKVPGTNGYQGAGARITWRRRVRYGTISSWIKAGPRTGPGVIFSFITMSPRGDEIDWEYVSGNPTNRAQNAAEFTWYRGQIPNTVPNFWGRGGRCAPRNGRDIRNNYHKYSIRWTQTTLTWLINDIECYTVRRSDPQWAGTLPNGTRYVMYPEEASNIQYGVWNAGGRDPAISPGTREWAGGYTDWNNAVNAQQGFSFTIANMSVTCG